MSENVIDNRQTDTFEMWLFLKRFEILIAKISGNAVESSKQTTHDVSKFKSKQIWKVKRNQKKVKELRVTKIIVRCR